LKECGLSGEKATMRYDMKTYSLPQRLLRALQELAGEYRRDGLELFIFGSFARGDQRPTSDLDIGVEWRGERDPETFLHLYRDVQALPTIRQIDLVDLTQVDPDFRRVSASARIYLREAISAMKKEALKRDFDDILSRWGEVLNQPESDIVRDSAILRFELTYEVAWKLVQLLAREEGYEVNSPRQAFQRAFTMGWVTDEEVWADIVQARNTAVHVYRQEYAQALYRKLRKFHKAFKELQNACTI